MALTRRRRRGLILNTALILVLAALGVTSYLVVTHNNTRPAAPIATVAVARGAVTSSVASSGTVESAQTATPQFTASGTVTAVLVTVGQHVAKGQALARIDPSSAQRSLLIAEYNLSASEDEFVQIGDNDAINRDLEPRRTGKVAPVTAVVAGVVLLAAGGLTGAVIAHASVAGNDSSAAPTNGPRGGYPGFANRGANPGGGGPATFGTVESVSGSTLKVKTQDGTVVTVTLTPDTDIEITRKGAATDLSKGSTVVVTGTGGSTAITATTVRQGDLFGGCRPAATPGR